MRERGDERALANVWEPNKCHIGEQSLLQQQQHLLARTAYAAGAAGGLVLCAAGGSVATTAAAAPCNQQLLAVSVQLTQQCCLRSQDRPHLHSAAADSLLSRDGARVVAH